MHRHRILVVDDDADWRAFVRTCLEDLGYETVEASCGEEALEKLRTEPGFSLMLLDLRMPGMDGKDVLEALPPNAPRVVLMTSASAPDAGSTLSSGPWYYMPKDAGTAALELMLDSLHAG